MENFKNAEVHNPQWGRCYSVMLMIFCVTFCRKGHMLSLVEQHAQIECLQLCMNCFNLNQSAEIRMSISAAKDTITYWM